MSNYDCARTDADILWSTIEADELQSAIVIAAQVDLLNWAMKLCYSGSTPAMIRRQLHNKLVEITGEGQKA